MHLLVNRDYDDCDDHDCDCDHCDDNDHDCEGDDGFFSSLCNHEKHRELKVTKLTAFKRFEVVSPGAGPVHASLPSPEHYF